MSGTRTKVVAVVGASDATAEMSALAEALGEAISDQGWHLVCGGGTGVMESACRGFRMARNELNAVRNLAIGILPREDTDFANEYVDLVIPTGMGWARNAVIVRMADAVIAVGGGSGTLSEIALAWQMDKPLVAMTIGGGWAARLAGESLDERRSHPILSAASPAAAIALIKPLIDADSFHEH